MADSYAGLGRLQRSRALERRSSPVAQLEAARASVAWHGKGLEIWAGWPTRAPSTAFDQGRRAEAVRAVAEAEGLVARLEGGTTSR
jgi:hypothetical protein